MYLAYFDETGDDGFPGSSNLFVLTSVYLHHQNWKQIYHQICLHRQYLKSHYNLPIKFEIHTKQLLLNKGNYRNLSYSENVRWQIALDFAQLISTLELQAINVCINKQKITPNNSKIYSNILDSALNFNIQRIENSIKREEPNSKFMIITDEGRVGSMQSTTRRVQKINFIPSKYNSNSYRREIELLIEDPLPKNSRDSHFIQISDFISFFVYLKLIGKNNWHNRLSWLQESQLDNLISTLKPIFNLDASHNNPLGFVIYPK